MGRNKKNTRKIKPVDDNVLEIKNNMIILDSNIYWFKKMIDDTKKGIVSTFDAICQKIEAIKNELKRQDDFVCGIFIKEQSWLKSNKNGNLFYYYINLVYNKLIKIIFYLEDSKKVFGKDNCVINNSINILEDYAYYFCAYSVNPSFKNLTKKINYNIW